MYAYEIIMTLIFFEVDKIPFFLSHCYTRKMNGFKMGENMKSSIIVIGIQITSSYDWEVGLQG